MSSPIYPNINSHELRHYAIQRPEDAKNFTIHVVPDELQMLAFEIVALQRKLQAKCREYDQKLLSIKIKYLEELREENKKIEAQERAARLAREEEKLRKARIKKLSKKDKSFYRLYGITPEEHFQKFMEEARRILGNES